MPVSLSLPDKLEVSELRGRLQQAGEALLDLRNKPADDRGDTYDDDVRSCVDFINEIDPLLTAALGSQAPQSRGPQAAFDTEERGPLTAGEQVTKSDRYEGQRGNFGAGFSEVQLRASIASREQRTLIDGGSVSFTFGDPNSGGAWRPLGTPIPPQVRELRLFIRDVLNVIPTTLGAVPYVQELNPATTETAATAVAEGNQKPEAVMTFTPALAPIVKIAAWIPVTEEILEDAPTLAGYINTRLGYMVALREEAQILNGPASSSPNMTGIRNTSGCQTDAGTAGDFPKTIGTAIGKIEAVDGEATFVAANPTDFWTAATTRHSTLFDNGYSPGAPAVLAGLTWGTTCIRTRSMESGKALTGAAMGATVVDRMESVIKIGNQHSDFFVGNKVAVLCEERVGLLVHRPDLFCVSTIS